MGYPERIDLIDYISLFEEIKKCKWKSELVDTFARYGIKDDTGRTVETKGTCKSGKSKDLYATFITVADNKKYKTHMQFLVGQIDIITVILYLMTDIFQNMKCTIKQVMDVETDVLRFRMMLMNLSMLWIIS